MKLKRRNIIKKILPQRRISSVLNMKGHGSMDGAADRGREKNHPSENAHLESAPEDQVFL